MVASWTIGVIVRSARLVCAALLPSPITPDPKTVLFPSVFGAGKIRTLPAAESVLRRTPRVGPGLQGGRRHQMKSWISVRTEVSTISEYQLDILKNHTRTHLLITDSDVRLTPLPPLGSPGIRSRLSAVRSSAARPSRPGVFGHEHLSMTFRAALMSPTSLHETGSSALPFEKQRCGNLVLCQSSADE